MNDRILRCLFVGVSLAFQSYPVFSFEPPDTLGTCSTHLSTSPLKLNSLYLFGDSLTNTSSFKAKMRAGVSVRDISYVGHTTVSGIGIGQALDLLSNEINHSDIAKSDILYTDLGVNNWGQAISNMTSLEALIDTFITDIKAINNNILILWQEPYGHLPLVPNPNIAIGASLVADYLRSKDEAGEICLIPWSDLATADPTAYTTVAQPDGVHIWGNESIYQEIAFDYIDSLM